jgi:hypothetical protein
VALSGRINKQDILICTLLLGFSVFLFRDIIIFNHLLFGSDFVSGYLGIKQFLLNEIHTHHAIPFWNPYIFGGIPFWAHFESTIFYPLDLPFWFMRPEKAYGYTMFAHLFLAGLFMYILARSFHMTRLGGFVASMVFTCNGFIMPTLHVGQMFRVQGYIWIPLIVYFLNQAYRLKRPALHAAAAGFFWGVQILAGSAQDPFYTFLVALLLLGCHMVSLRNPGSTARLLAATGLFFVVGSGIAAIQIIPAFEFIGQSVRAVLDRYEFVTLGSYPPEGIITTVMPNFFGNYVTGDFWVSDVPWSIPDYSLYVGVLPLILLFFITIRGSDNREVVFFAGGLALVSLILALGSHLPVYKLAYALPGFNRIRAPAKIIVLWAFALALLAGRGMDGLFTGSPRSLVTRVGLVFCAVISLLLLDVLCHADRSLALRFFSPFVLEQAIPDKMVMASSAIRTELHRFVVFGGLILLTLLLLMRRLIPPRAGAVILCALLLIDLAYTSRGAVEANDPFYRWAHEVKRDFDATLGRDRGVFRVASCDLVPNMEMYLGYQTVAGYTPMFPHRYYAYINRYFKGQLPQAWVWFSYKAAQDKILMDLLNVKYEISYGERAYHVRRTCLPRAFLIPGCRILQAGAVLDELTKPEFEPTRTVLLEGGDEPCEAGAGAAGPSSPGNSATIVLYRPDEVIVLTEAGMPGYLFLGDMFYPGWKAFVDGKQEPIMRGDYLFRVVRIPAGEHEVQFVFDPFSIKLGIAITILTVFLVIGIVVYGLARRGGPPWPPVSA